MWHNGEDKGKWHNQAQENNSEIHELLLSLKLITMLMVNGK